MYLLVIHADITGRDIEKKELVINTNYVQAITMGEDEKALILVDGFEEPIKTIETYREVKNELLKMVLFNQQPIK